MSNFSLPMLLKLNSLIRKIILEVLPNMILDYFLFGI